MKTTLSTHSVWTNPIHFLAFGFGSGTFPYAPGTMGTLMAIPFYLLLRDLPLTAYLIVLGLASVVGVLICEITQRQLGVHDYKGIVWDEFCGYWLTMLMAPRHWSWIIIGFFLFRLFDIWKPWPIRLVDQKIKNGFGVMLDDVLAGIYSFAILQGLVWLSDQL